MKKIRNIILGLIILIIIIILILVYAIFSKENESANNISENDLMDVHEITNSDKFTKEENINNFFNKENQISQFIDYFQNELQAEETNKMVYSILFDNYIVQNNITENNVLEYFSDYKNISNWGANEIYYKMISKENTADVSHRISILSGIETKDVQGEIQYNMSYFMIIEDNETMAYSILPLSEEEYNNIKEKGNTSAYEKTIEKNEYNQILENKTFTDYMLCIKYLTNYQNIRNYNYEMAYNLLDPEYREKRFKTLDNYKEYVEESDNIVLDKYLVNINAEYTEYICIDKNENYYIFKATNPMEYTLTLDTYTIISDNFKQAYNNANPEERAQMNIDKFVNMLNTRDFQNIYDNLFTQGFKQNAFPTLEDFKNFAKNTFFKYNKVNYMEFGNQGNILTYRIELLDKTGNYDGSIIADIIMQIEDNYNFKISFDTNISRFSEEAEG